MNSPKFDLVVNLFAFLLEDFQGEIDFFVGKTFYFRTHSELAPKFVIHFNAERFRFRLAEKHATEI